MDYKLIITSVQTLGVEENSNYVPLDTPSSEVLISVPQST